jgi:hypothetical protein
VDEVDCGVIENDVAFRSDVGESEGMFVFPWQVCSYEVLVSSGRGVGIPLYRVCEMLTSFALKRLCKRSER